MPKPESIYMAKVRAARVKRGLCAYCGKPSDRVRSGEYVICEECSAHNSQVRAERIERMKEEHRCIICGAQDERTLNGLLNCATCAEKRRKSNNGLRETLKNRRICTRCWKNDVMPGKKLCKECLAQGRAESAERRRNAKETSSCVICGKQDDRTLSGKTYCAACAEKNREYRLKRREARKKQGLCINCNNMAAPGRTLCHECLEKRRRDYRERKEALDNG